MPRSKKRPKPPRKKLTGATAEQRALVASIWRMLSSSRQQLNEFRETSSARHAAVIQAMLRSAALDEEMLAAIKAFQVDAHAVADRGQLKEQVAVLERRVHEEQARAAKFDGLNTAARRSWQEALNDRDQLRVQVEHLEDGVARLERDRVGLCAERDKLEQRVATLIAKIESLEELPQSMENQVGATVDAKTECDELRAELDRMAGKYDDAAATRDRLQRRVNVLERRIVTLELESAAPEPGDTAMSLSWLQHFRVLLGQASLEQPRKECEPIPEGSLWAQLLEHGEQGLLLMRRAAALPPAADPKPAEPQGRITSEMHRLAERAAPHHQGRTSDAGKLCRLILAALQAEPQEDVVSRVEANAMVGRFHDAIAEVRKERDYLLAKVEKLESRPSSAEIEAWKQRVEEWIRSVDGKGVIEWGQLFKDALDLMHRADSNDGGAKQLALRNQLDLELTRVLGSGPPWVHVDTVRLLFETLHADPAGGEK